MAKVTRRKMLAGTGLGVAAVGTLTAVPGLVTSRQQSSSHTTPTLPTAKKVAPPETIPTVAYVRDAAKGEVVLMFGTREVVRTDPALVAYLGHCCGSEIS